MRLIAVRRSVTDLPLRLSDAELEILSKRAAKAGSEPTTRTTCSMEDFGSDRMRRTRTAISGNDGRSTLPPDSSPARDRMNSNATSERACGWMLKSFYRFSMANRSRNPLLLHDLGNRHGRARLERPASILPQMRLPAPR